MQLALLLVMFARLHDEYKRLPIRPGSVTTTLLLAMIAIHLFPELLPPVIDCCISSSAVWRALRPAASSAWSWLFEQRSTFDRASEVARRLTLSTLLHADDVHLYYNLVSLIWKGGMLEGRMGSETFCAFVLYAVVASGTIAVGLGIAAEVLELGTLHCAVGFSGVLYAMSAVALHENPDGPAIVHGIPVRRRHAIWIEAVVSSMLHYHVSFLGHLAGGAAGVLWCHARTHSGPMRWPVWRSRGRFYGGGRLGDVGPAQSARHGSRAPRPTLNRETLPPAMRRAQSPARRPRAAYVPID